MRKLKPEIKNIVASVLVSSVALFGTHTISKAVENQTSKNVEAIKQTFSVEQVDGDTVKVCLDGITESVKAVEFSVVLDENIKLNNVRALLDDNIVSYTTNNNEVKILVTSIEGLKQVGNKVELVKLDIAPKDNSKLVSANIKPLNVSEYRYVNSSNVEYSITSSENDFVENVQDTLITYNADNIKVNDGEGSTETPTTPNPDNGNNQTPSNPEVPSGGNNQTPSTGGSNNSTNNGSGGSIIYPDSGNNSSSSGQSKPQQKPENQPETSKPVITDVPDTYWAKYHIDKFIQAGYINGYEDNTFRPNNQTTRAEFIKLVNRVFNFTEKGTQSFKDVSESNWFYNDVLIAVKAGYINGYEDNTFRPNEPITRQEACKILATVLNAKGDGNLNFTDSESISNWAKEYVDALEDMNIINGYEDKTFKPKNNITRAETVKILDVSMQKK